MAETAPAPTGETDVAAQLAEVKARIDAAARAAGRAAGSITLVAISKAQPIERPHAALVAGHRTFGENRVQEAGRKWPALKAQFDDVRLHLVGPLQRNKVRDAVALFDVIESVDRPHLARTLAAEMAAQARRPQCYVQVNTGEEAQKAGIAPGEADRFIAMCREEFGLPVTGVMCIPPMDEPPALHFALLADIARRNDLAVISMGMSADYQEAIAFGATHVRVGSAIFGARPPR